jgi:hypothetical protein
MKRSPAKKSAATAPENQTASESVAAAILTKYRDLAPSVNRIMESDLGENGRLHAITLFQASLDAPGDPMRNPMNAVAAAQMVAAETS